MRQYVHGCEIIQYADDTQFVHVGRIDALPDLISAAQTTFSQTRDYFNKNGLLLNANKTQCLFIGTRAITRQIPENTTLTYANTTISPCKHIKNLGVYIDSHLTFDKHIYETHRKVMGNLLFINRIKDKFDSVTRKIAIESLALSNINYCLPIYGTASTTLLKQIQKLQNFAAKICIGGATRRDHATPFITQLKWLKIDKKIMYDTAINLYKIKTKSYPEWFVHLPTTAEVTQSRYTTRQQDNLHVPHTSSHGGARSLLVLGPRLWNTLPHYIKQSGTIHMFRSRLKIFLLNNDVYVN